MSMESPPPAMRLQNIQALRGIAALLVVLSHLFIIEQKYAGDRILGQWIELGMVGVDLFFVISGFIMVHVAWSFRRGLKAVLEFLFARASRIYPLYWFVSLLTLGVWFWRPEIVFSSMGDAPDFLKSFLLVPDDRMPFLAIGWTLIHEMFFYLVFAIALFFKPKFMLPFLSIWAVILGLGIVAGLDHISPLSEILFNPLSFEFLMGAFAAWLFKMYNAPLSTIAALLAGLVSLTAMAIALQNHGGMPQTYSDRALLFGLPATLAVYGLAGMEVHGKLFSKALSRLGDWSYSLYLTHILSLSLVGRLWNYLTKRGFGQESVWDNVVLLIFMTIFAVFVSYLCWRFVEKPMLDLAKKTRSKWFKKV